MVNHFLPTRTATHARHGPLDIFGSAPSIRGGGGLLPFYPIHCAIPGILGLLICLREGPTY